MWEGKENIKRLRALDSKPRKTEPRKKTPWSKNTHHQATPESQHQSEGDRLKIGK